MDNIHIFQLPNGIQVIHKEEPSTRIVHCGFTLDIGSRDERMENMGIAHFWEHMAFKGTRKRKAFHILSRLDSVGGELNAYTTKEKITFYASVLQNYFENAFELLTDITFDSIFPENQIEKERNVILEEMAMYRDSPEDSLHDEFDHVIFGNHPLGMNILGTTKSVKEFSRKDFKSFIKENINTEKIVFSCVGNIPFKKVKKFAEKYLSNIPAQTAENKRKPFLNYIPQERVIQKNISQALCAIGSDGYSIHNDKKLIFYLLVNLLGGPAMNSRLNMALREKKGFVYSIDAHYVPFTDTGMFGIYFGTDPSQLNKSIKAIRQELDKLVNQKLGVKQLLMAKEQLMGQIAMSEENNANYMLMMGKNMLDLGGIEPIENVFKSIETVTSSQIFDVANEVFKEKELSILKFIPNQ